MASLLHCTLDGRDAHEQAALRAEKAGSFDVVVIGSGIAGSCAAISAAEAGAKVALITSGPSASGASFYGSTWGLGLVGPRDEDDINDFIAQILSVGSGVAKEELVTTLVRGIDPSIEWLREHGVKLKEPDSPQERAYIPCFDTKTRGWHGLLRDELSSFFEREFKQLGIEVVEYHKLVDLRLQEGRVAAGLFLDEKHSSLVSFFAKSFVLASGGVAGLYARSLMGPYVQGNVHGIALRTGAELYGIEFVQFMPALLTPKAGLVFNEKSFRYTDLAERLSLNASLLEERSTYGPFSSRFAARAVDEALANAGDVGLALRFSKLDRELPEFVRDFFSWMKETHGINPSDELSITHFAHAANGGIAIDTSAKTAVSGLFAAGECTGGVHGADRMGGLSSANALVFGRIAGRSAAEDAHVLAAPKEEQLYLPAVSYPDYVAAKLVLKREMMAAAGPIRSEMGLSKAKARIEEFATLPVEARESVQEIAHSYVFADELRLAYAMINAMLERTESLGSHYRVDA